MRIKDFKSTSGTCRFKLSIMEQKNEMINEEKAKKVNRKVMK